jgi:hypothetical protein
MRRGSAQRSKLELETSRTRPRNGDRAHGRSGGALAAARTELEQAMMELEHAVGAREDRTDHERAHRAPAAERQVRKASGSSSLEPPRTDDRSGRLETLGSELEAVRSDRDRQRVELERVNEDRERMEGRTPTRQTGRARRWSGCRPLAQAAASSTARPRAGTRQGGPGQRRRDRTRRRGRPSSARLEHLEVQRRDEVAELQRARESLANAARADGRHPEAANRRGTPRRARGGGRPRPPRPETRNSSTRLRRRARGRPRHLANASPPPSSGPRSLRSTSTTCPRSRCRSGSVLPAPRRLDTGPRSPPSEPGQAYAAGRMSRSTSIA